jgi:urease accessory protein
MSSSWKIYMLVDSGLPTGGFAHSNGLESAVTNGLIGGTSSLDCFVREALLVAFHSQVPLMLQAMGDEAGWLLSDKLAEAVLTCRVAQRASRSLGDALLRVSAEAFPEHAAELRACRKVVLEGNAPGHQAPAFGRVCGLLGLDALTAAQALLFITARDMLSAATRLSLLGPLQAARMLGSFAKLTEELASMVAISENLPAQVNPLLEIVQGSHDRQYSRLFSS